MKAIPVVTRIAALTAVVVGIATAFALPVGADVGILSPPIAGVQIGSPATLGTRGVTVTVPVTVICAYSGTGYLTVEVIQAVKSDIAYGHSNLPPIGCSGNFQTLNVVVTATQHPFRQGVALATAYFTVCDSTGCLQNTHEREIRIVR